MSEVDLEVVIYNWKVNINCSMKLHREYFAKKCRISDETFKPCPTEGNSRLVEERFLYFSKYEIAVE
jgi:hypothetical protein